MERNRGFDLLKVWFILIIVMHHAGLLSAVLRRGYMAVEFYFLVSGFLLYQTFAGGRPTPFAYLKRRLKRLYVPYICAYLLIAGFYLLTRTDMGYAKPWSFLYEIFLVQNIGLPGQGGLNYPLWYLSVLVVGGLLVYVILYCLPEKVSVIFMAVWILAAYGWMIANGGIEHWDNILLVLYPPLFRGMADMMAGCLIARFRDRIPAVLGKFDVPLFILSLVLMCMPGPGILDHVTALVMALLTAALTTEQSRFRKAGEKSRWMLLVPYEYAIFLNHALVIILTRVMYWAGRIGNWAVQVLLLYAVMLAFAVVFTKITGKLQRLLFDKNRDKG